ncbi:hypothetical protein CHU98_g3911 [Xylaria longipes]|nr:hypothetical protein CHU98_g3911 [Xylaria longipes]
MPSSLGSLYRYRLAVQTGLFRRVTVTTYGLSSFARPADVRYSPLYRYNIGCLGSSSKKREGNRHFAERDPALPAHPLPIPRGNQDPMSGVPASDDVGGETNDELGKPGSANAHFLKSEILGYIDSSILRGYGLSSVAIRPKQQSGLIVCRSTPSNPESVLSIVASSAISVVDAAHRKLGRQHDVQADCLVTRNYSVYHTTMTEETCIWKD